MKILDNIPVEGKLQQSALFFNHFHDNFEALFLDGNGFHYEPTSEEKHAAILLDAIYFAAAYGGDAQWYADDFMRQI